MTVSDFIRSKQIPVGCLGIQPEDNFTGYFCTPEGADVFGSAGVDGIHYCTVPGFGETIFAVSPMNRGDFVHPIAECFEDLLRLLLACGDMAALEQCYAWDREQYKAFLADCPPTAKQREAMDVIARNLELTPMEDAFGYVKKLQAEFDLSKIPYTEDYFDPDMNPEAPPPTWEIFFCENRRSEAGTPVSVDKSFSWAGMDWFIPEVYVCREGIVVLSYGRADAAPVRESLAENTEISGALCPLNLDFRCSAKINGKAGIFSGANTMTWLPPLPGEGTGWAEARWALDHYGFDRSFGWLIRRDSILWPKGEKKLKSLAVTFSAEPLRLPGACFKTPDVSENVVLTHPVSKKDFILTVVNLREEESDIGNLRPMDMQFPTFFTLMEYRIEPDSADSVIRIEDALPGDSPRHISAKGEDGFDFLPQATLGIIGGADGPTAIITAAPAPQKTTLKTAVSSLRFERPQEIRWRAVFFQKLWEDLETDLI
ncbi:MAG: hypothetical protein IKZ19_05635 [Clostridia bacterium]|nr:hypothetical protein [Clostridia bacterium]